MILLGEEAAGIILKTFDKNERELVCSEMANLPMLDLEKQQTILGNSLSVQWPQIPPLRGVRNTQKSSRARGGYV